MSDPTISSVISRVSLGLTPLQINSGGYKLVTIFGGARAWRRQTVHSPYVDGEFTTSRTLGVVEDTIVIDVRAANQTAANTLLKALIGAFDQPSYSVTVYINEQAYTYQCEAADYTMNWEQARIMGITYQISFAVRRSPVPINGGI